MSTLRNGPNAFTNPSTPATPSPWRSFRTGSRASPRPPGGTRTEHSGIGTPNGGRGECRQPVTVLSHVGDTSNASAVSYEIVVSAPASRSTWTSVPTVNRKLPAASVPSAYETVSGRQANSTQLGRQLTSARRPNGGSTPSPLSCTHGGQPFLNCCSVTESPAQGRSGTIRSDVNERTSESSGVPTPTSQLTGTSYV